MSTQIIAIKLTPEETDLLDALVVATSSRSRSDVLRQALLRCCERHRQLKVQVFRATESRRGIVARRRRRKQKGTSMNGTSSCSGHC